MKCLVLLFAIVVTLPIHTALSAQQRTTRQAFQQFTLGAHECQLHIDSVLRATDQSSSEALSVNCDNKSVLSYRISDAGLGGLQVSPQDGTIFVWCERGTGIDFTAFQLTQDNGVSSKKIFESWTEFGVDVLPLSNELLVHHSKRFVDGESTILPKWTEKYIRAGDSYKLVQVYQWKDTMRWKDTYCILVPLTASCPATVEEKTHPWDQR